MFKKEPGGSGRGGSDAKRANQTKIAEGLGNLKNLSDIQKLELGALIRETKIHQLREALLRKYSAIISDDDADIILVRLLSDSPADHEELYSKYPEYRGYFEALIARKKTS